MLNRIEVYASKAYNEDLIEALFESLSSNFQGGVLLVSSDGVVHEINDFALKLLHDKELIKQKEIVEGRLFHLKKTDFFFQGVVKSISQNCKVVEKVVFDFNQTNSIFTVEYKPLKDQDLSLITIRNNQSQVEEANFYKMILDELPADIAVFDKNHKYLFTNKRAIKDAETRQWMIGKDDFDYCKRKGISSSMAVARRQEFNKAVQNQNAEVIESTKKTGPNGADSWTVRWIKQIRVLSSFE
ncbi:MAG: hypothetical protein WD135_03250, partial [Ferruginibacter sp.]